MRQIEELKEGTAKKEAELVEIKKAQTVNVSVHNWKFSCYVLINHRLILYGSFVKENKTLFA